MGELLGAPHSQPRDAPSRRCRHPVDRTVDIAFISLCDLAYAHCLYLCPVLPLYIFAPNSSSGRRLVMSKFLARFGGGKKKEGQSPNASPSASTSARHGTPASPASERRKSKQLFNFGLPSPGSVAERPSTARNQSTGTTSSSVPKIELDFGERTSDTSTSGSELQSTGVGLQSPITGELAIKTLDTGSREDGKERQVISEAEVELLRETRFTWAQVERAWDVAGQELKVIGTQTVSLNIAAVLNLSIRLEDTEPIPYRIRRKVDIFNKYSNTRRD